VLGFTLAFSSVALAFGAFADAFGLSLTRCELSP
jgi:hypothetical protein